MSKYSTLRALLALAAMEDLEAHLVDIKTTFLNDILENRFTSSSQLATRRVDLT